MAASSSSSTSSGFGLKTLYLLLFNLVSLVLWAVILAMTITTITEQYRQGAGIPQLSVKVQEAVGGLVQISQKLAWLEPVHVLVGLARGSLPAAIIQNFGRSMVLFTVVGLFPVGHATVFTPLLYLAWACSEVVRYPLYILPQLGMKAPLWLTWLRYSAFIVLYPIGIISEVALYVVSFEDLSKAVSEEDLLSYRMPNTLNFAFDFKYFVVFGLAVLYPLSGPGLYLYMLSQRAATLKKAKEAATRSKEA